MLVHTKRFISIVLLILFVNSVQSSNVIDSLKIVLGQSETDFQQKHIALDKIVFHYSPRQLDSAETYVNLLLQNAIESKDDLLLCKAYYDNSFVAYLSGNKKGAIEYGLKCVKLGEKIKEPMLVSKGFSQLAITYQSLFDFKIAQEYYLKALSIAEKIGDKELICGYTNNFARFYQAIGNVPKAKTYYTKSLEIAKQINSPKFLAMSYQNLGGIYIQLGETEKGITLTDKALIHYKQIDSKSNIAQIYVLKASVQLEQKAYNISLDYLYKSIEIGKNLNDSIMLSLNYSLMVENFLGLNKLDSALIYLNRQFEINQIQNNLIGMTDCYHLYYRYYDRVGDKHKSLDFYELYLVHKDSIHDIELQNELNQAQAKFDLSQQRYSDSVAFEKLRVIDIIRVESEQEKIKLVYVSVCGCLFLILVFCFLYFKKHTKKNKLEKEALLNEIKLLKTNFVATTGHQLPKFEKKLIVNELNLKLNDTDLSILKQLYDVPSLTNKELSEKVFLSYEGVRSSLKKMYLLFNINKTSKNKKELLVLKIIEIISDNQV